jgi:predicted GNAT family acetyltransferase
VDGRLRQGSATARVARRAESWLERRLVDPDGGIVFWLDQGRPVSFASFGGPTPNGIGVGPVYTPPEARCRGYATALVAQLTKMLIEGGRRFCFLDTDLANPTSNSIYPRVGYEPVTDAGLWSFQAP